jgi:hypothetical protein
MSSRALSNLLLAAILLFSATNAFAWGADGHRLVCGLALHSLSEKGRAFVRETLAMGKYLDGNGDDDFAEACVWPDKAKYADFKGTYEEHFINVPKSEDSVDFARDCAAMDCIAVGIQRSLTWLARPASGEREQARKAASLRFLGHFIGDLHQPLHVSNAEDWGGNKIKVKWFGEDSNLHAVWDVGILERAGIRYPQSLEMLESRKTEIGSRNVLMWMRESFRIARGFAYPGIDGKPVQAGDELGEAYLGRSEPIVIQQLSRAGVRLAYLIDSLADGTLDTNILIQ